MRVLHIVPSVPFGGAQRLALDIAHEQRERGIDAQLLLTNVGEQLEAEADRSGVPWQSAGSGVARIAATRKAALQVDVLHLHVVPPWVAAALPSQPRVIMHLHTRPPRQVHDPSLQRYLQGFGLRMLVNRADHLIAISGWVADSWAMDFPQSRAKTTIVYNGIDLPSDLERLEREESDGPFTIGVACRLSDRKGIAEFIELAGAIHSLDDAIRFRIAGDGPWRETYERMAYDAGLSVTIAFCGFVDDMASFWASCDAAVFSAPFEPFGLRLIEPIAHGVPVLAYLNGSGSDEVISRCRGVTAVAYGDTDAFAREVLSLKADPKRRRQMVALGCADIEAHFTRSAMTCEILSVYKHHDVETSHA